MEADIVIVEPGMIDITLYMCVEVSVFLSVLISYYSSCVRVCVCTLIRPPLDTIIA